MKRLTKRVERVVCYIGKNKQNDEDTAAEISVPAIRDVLGKLAEYEDTGLEPEEISIRRWIPVTERLPEPLVNVLALYGDGRMDIDWVDHEGCFVYENLYDGVTH